MIRGLSVSYKLGGGKSLTGTCGFRIEYRTQKMVKDLRNIYSIVPDRRGQGS